MQCYYALPDFHRRFLLEHDGLDNAEITSRFPTQGQSVKAAIEVLRIFRDTCLDYSKSAEETGKPIMPPGLPSRIGILLVFKILNELNFCITQKIVWRKLVRDAYRFHETLNLDKLHNQTTCLHCALTSSQQCNCVFCVSALSAFWRLYSATYIDAGGNSFTHLRQLAEQTLFVAEPASELAVLTVNDADVQQVNERERSLDVLRFFLCSNFCAKIVRAFVCKCRTDLLVSLALLSTPPTQLYESAMESI
jgi:hypothetical protein